MTHSISQVPLRWQAATTPDELQPILRTLGEEYPIREAASDGLLLRFERADNAETCSVTRAGDEAVIRYVRPALAMRAVSSLLAGLVADGATLQEETPFTTFGIMLDCSRNAVMTVEHFKQWLRRLTLLGYNMAMLYTEDTYELPDEPFFGYQRGRYTLAELQEIDAYAGQLGIEMIGCIQTLGHLAQILRWPAYRDVRDTADVLLVGEEKTYALIEKMVVQMSKAFKSRRPHIGMDETHDVGQGKYRELHGERAQFDIFNEHLARVVEICERHGYANPMIWSDMYFRMGSKTGDYYDKECIIPDEVQAKIPQQAELVYWDYYHDDKAFYVDWIQRHRALGFEPLMGSGVWTWLKVWYDRLQTERTAGPCIDACRETGLKEIFFTMWGDDGAYCDFDSALLGLAYAAEKAYRGVNSDDPLLAPRFEAVCRGNFAVAQRASEFDAAFCSGYLFWDDPLYSLVIRNVARKDGVDLREREQALRAITRDLEPALENREAGDLHHAWLLSQALAEKIGISYDLYDAYAARDYAALAAMQSRALRMADLLAELTTSYRAMWMRHNKPFGFEVLQIRLSGSQARYRELATRLGELLDGAVTAIPELDGNLEPPVGYLPGMNYRNSAVPTANF